MSRRTVQGSQLDSSSPDESLAGGLHLGGALGEHHPAEEFGRGTVVGGVDVLPDGHDANILLGELRLDPHTIVEVPG